MTKDKSIDNQVIDNLLKNYKKPEDLIGENGLLKQLTKRLLEPAMSAEMTEHVGYDKHDAAGNNNGNSRNGKSAKTIKGTFGELALETPRDRNGTFEPQIIEKHQNALERGVFETYCPFLSSGDKLLAFSKVAEVSSARTIPVRSPKPGLKSRPAQAV